MIHWWYIYNAFMNRLQEIKNRLDFKDDTLHSDSAQ
jgi:hypothetical protein